MMPETQNTQGKIDISNATVEDFQKDLSVLKIRRDHLMQQSQQITREAQGVEDNIIRIQGMLDLKTAQEEAAKKAAEAKPLQIVEDTDNKE